MICIFERVTTANIDYEKMGCRFTGNEDPLSEKLSELEMQKRELSKVAERIITKE